MMLKGTTYEKTSRVFHRLPGGTPDSRDCSGRSADVKELFAIDLADYPGKEGRMIEVSYPPGVQDVVHRHDAHAFVYVLEGPDHYAVERPTCRYAQGRADVLRGAHRRSRRGAQRQQYRAARFVVVLLKGKGAPILTPVKE
jgi:hypothetical protein